MVERPDNACRWVGLSDALARFVGTAGGTESAAHIKPLHWYVASRLVIEGGFHPDDITPHPPFAIQRRARQTYSSMTRTARTTASGPCSAVSRPKTSMW
jgi:hypothetical protein